MTNTCFDVYKNINIVSGKNNVELGPCCISPTRIADKIDFENNLYLNEVRNSWKQNIPHVACNACKIAETAGINSRRIGSNQWYIDNNYNNTNVELIRIDYSTGDLCNLRCAICGPRFSSAWKQELNIPIQHRKVIVNSLWKNLDLSKLKFIHFNGGEPLLSKEHIRFLKEIPNKSELHINYNTNGTVRPWPELLELWGDFKLVQLDFSIDDIGPRFNYQRYPAIWEEVVNNLNYFRDNCPVNCMFAINSSIGVLNSANYPNLLKWAEINFPANRLGDLVECRTQLTTGILSLKDFSNRKAEIVLFLDKLDSRRNTNWKLTFPELVNLL